MAPTTGNAEDRLWTVDDVAKYIGLHPQTVYRKTNEGEIPVLRLGRRLRFRPEDIVRWCERQRTGGATKAGAA